MSGNETDVNELGLERRRRDVLIVWYAGIEDVVDKVGQLCKAAEYARHVHQLGFAVLETHADAVLLGHVTQLVEGCVQLDVVRDLVDTDFMLHKKSLKAELVLEDCTLLHILDMRQLAVRAMVVGLGSEQLVVLERALDRVRYDYVAT